MRQEHKVLRKLRGLIGAATKAAFCLLLASGLATAAGAQSKEAILNEYLSTIESCDIPTKIEECDFILDSCDSASLAPTALKVFCHFRDSKLMGDENVAVHVAEKWILPFYGEQADSIMPAGQADSVSVSDIRNYVDFNRESLLGMKAPLLPEAGLDSFSGEKPTVLWFFDTECAKCRLESVKIQDFFSRHDDCVFVSFYIGDDRTKWKEFIMEHFSGIEGAVHLMDAEERSGFRRKYSVNATPRMYLIDTDGLIAGRMLDTDSLEELLEERDRQKKEAVSELFYQLIPLRGEDAKASLEYVIDKYILCENSIFNTAEDSLMVVGFAQIQKDLLSKARPGTKIVPLKVKGSLNGAPVKEYRLDRLGSAIGRRKVARGEGMSRKAWKKECGKTVIVFHTRGCGQCKEELEAAKKRNLNVFDIDIDDIQAQYPSVFEAIVDSFDLTALPFLVETDSKGIILHRYISLR